MIWYDSSQIKKITLFCFISLSTYWMGNFPMRPYVQNIFPKRVPGFPKWVPSFRNWVPGFTDLVSRFPERGITFLFCEIEVSGAL